MGKKLSVLSKRRGKILSVLSKSMGKKLSVLSKRRGKIQNKGVIASFYNSSQRMEYDSNSLMGICSSVTVLRQSLMAARTSSIISSGEVRKSKSA